ncbi:hypothetical protein KC887_07050 [Candidatus Kaiserbacteria bacterium]|nr:hypothetical protein [Candidatus Kaiserbacteria bacterium]
MGVIEFRVATEFNVVKVKVTKETQSRVNAFSQENRCLGCEELIVDTDRKRRGLCSTCYAGVIHAIKKHGASEKQLMEEGKLLPPSPGGRKPANKFTASLCGRESEVA